MKKITLSADGDLIEAARRRAALERTTLSAQFRLWFSDYVGRERQASTAAAVMGELQGKIARWTQADSGRDERALSPGL